MTRRSKSPTTKTAPEKEKPWYANAWTMGFTLCFMTIFAASIMWPLTLAASIILAIIGNMLHKQGIGLECLFIILIITYYLLGVIVAYIITRNKRFRQRHNQ